VLDACFFLGAANIVSRVPPHLSGGSGVVDTKMPSSPKTEGRYGSGLSVVVLGKVEKWFFLDVPGSSTNDSESMDNDFSSLEGRDPFQESRDA